MLLGHELEILLPTDATPGAAEIINEWVPCGHEVSIITGRPSSVYEPFRIWLDEIEMHLTGIFLQVIG